MISNARISPPFSTTYSFHLASKIDRCSFLHRPCNQHALIPLHSGLHVVHTCCSRILASNKEVVDETSPVVLNGEQHNQNVAESIQVLKNAAKTRKVPKTDVLSALAVIEKVKLDPGKFLETLGGSKSPGRTWMLIFTAEKKLKGGRYFPITAVQRFDAEARRIENGVYLGPLGCLAFEGRFSWKTRVLSFIFEQIRIKIGPFSPWTIDISKTDNREPNTKDPFFIWFYIDDDIAVARGKSGGTAFWCRCQRVSG